MAIYLVYINDWRTLPTEIRADTAIEAVACARSCGIQPPFEVWRLNSCVWRVDAEPEFPDAAATHHIERDGPRAQPQAAIGK